MDVVYEFENAYTPWGLLTSLLVKGNGIDKQYVSFYNLPSFRGYASLDCAEANIIGTSGNIHYLEADITIEEVIDMSFTMSVTCIAATTPSTDMALITRMSTLFQDLDDCMDVRPSLDSPYDEIVCQVSPVRLTEHWLTGEDRIYVSNGQHISFNVRISFS